MGPKSTRRIAAPQLKLEPMSSRFGFSRRATLLVLAFALFLIGCGSPVEKAAEQTTEQTYEVEATGTFGIRNAAGAVRIYGSDDANMQVKTTKKAWDAEQLAAIAGRVSVQTSAISIETSFPPQKTWRFSHRAGSVDYAITLPRTIKISRLEVGNGEVSIEGMRGDVRADLVNGGMTTRNCFGTVQLSVANGTLDLIFEKWQQRPFSVDSRIIAGNGRVVLPRAVSFHLLAETANGNVSNHFARPEEQDSRRAARVNISIGPDPRPEITIRATNGDIEIAAAKSE